MENTNKDPIQLEDRLGLPDTADGEVKTVEIQENVAYDPADLQRALSERHLVCILSFEDITHLTKLTS